MVNGTDARTADLSVHGGQPMKLVIDTEARTLERLDGAGRTPLDLYSDEAFAAIADLYVKVGWNQKYLYTFTWMGRPIIQMPDDVMRIQEAIHAIRPDLVIETGVAHGGSLVLYASLMEAMGHGHVVGIDIEIRPHNRAAIEAHPLFKRITLVEGSSTAPEIVSRVKDQARGHGKVMVILDSNHTKEHVAAELEAYAPLVTPGSYIIATDGVMSQVADTPRGKPEWVEDNPSRAAEDFAARHPEFTLLPEPPTPFNESTLTRQLVTHWPQAWLLRKG
jgi:cephalosporin hydroxylase